MRITIFLIFGLFVEILPIYGQSNEIALQVNDIVVSKNEFDFLLNEYIVEYRKVHGAEPQKDSLQLWKRNYIDRMLLIADAYDRHLVNKDIDNAVQVMSKYMISLPSSSFYLSKFGKEVVEQEAIDAYKKREIKYEIDYFQFDTSEKLKEFLSVEGNHAFTNQALKSTLKQITLIWPVSKFAFEGVWDMKERQVSGPINSSSGHYLLKVRAITKNEQQAFDLEKDKIEKTLKMYYQIIANHSYVEELKRGITFDTSGINRLWIDYRTGLLKQGRHFSEQNDKLLTYWLDKHKRNVSLTDFLDYYNDLPIRRKLNTLQHLYDFLTSIVVAEQLYCEAEALGFTGQSDFVFRKNRFRNKLVFKEYCRKMIEPKLARADNIKIKEKLQSQLGDELISEARRKFKTVVNFDLE